MQARFYDPTIGRFLPADSRAALRLAARAVEIERLPWTYDQCAIVVQFGHGCKIAFQRKPGNEQYFYAFWPPQGARTQQRSPAEGGKAPVDELRGMAEEQVRALIPAEWEPRCTSAICTRRTSRRVRSPGPTGPQS
jgi:hypothetical protein